MRVVVVDANAHIRRLIATLLGALGRVEVVEARTPMAAVPLLLDQPADLVIVDWTTDPTEVLLFVHRLRHGDLGKFPVPVLAMAASTHHAVLERAWQAGIDDVIAKPISAIEVMQRSASLLAAARPAADAPGAEAAAAE